MLPCKKFKARSGRPGHFPPQPDLVSNAVLLAGLSGMSYRTCGCARLLQPLSAEDADVWQLANGERPA
jgi:hypothetical protein